MFILTLGMFVIFIALSIWGIVKGIIGVLSKRLTYPRFIYNYEFKGGYAVVVGIAYIVVFSLALLMAFAGLKLLLK